MAYSRGFRRNLGEIELVGTLHLPSQTGPQPALVMLQGSGPTDRDSNGYFPPIRDHFVDNGIAVLSWDKPGIGESTGHWTNQTFFDRADEALVALAWLRDQPEIDPQRVGIWGHSQGGWIGPLVASQDPLVAFLIVNSGPGVTAHEQDLHGVQRSLELQNATDDEIAAARRFMEALHEAAGLDAPYPRVVQELLDPAAGTPWFEYFGTVDADVWHFFVINAQRPYDPVPTLERIACPILAVFGEADALVPVVKSVRVFDAAQLSNPHRDITVATFPAADHRIKVSQPHEFAPGYLDTMTQWIWSRIATK